MTETVEVLNQETGERGRISRRLFNHPYFNRGVLVEVDRSQKPYVPGMFKSRLTEPAIDPATVEESEEDAPVEIEEPKKRSVKKKED